MPCDRGAHTARPAQGSPTEEFPTLLVLREDRRSNLIRRILIRRRRSRSWCARLYCCLLSHLLALLLL
jgi:hypothetical protein